MHPLFNCTSCGYVAGELRMTKYWHVVGIGIQNNLTYRFNFMTRALFGFIPLLAMISVWRAIFAEKEPGSTVASYTLAQMISYYLLTTVVDALTAVNEDDWQIATDIKDGNISQFLLKPINYLYYRLCLFFSGRLAYVAVAGGPILIFVLWFKRYFILPPDSLSFGLFLFSMCMTALLQFFISYSLAMLAFWVLEVSTFIFIVFAFEYIASGHLFPLDILPRGLEQALYYTPFPYQLFFPVSIYMGKASETVGIGRGLLLQFLWVVLAYVLARVAWAAGIKKYSAAGG